MFMKRIVWLFVLAGWAALWAAPLQLRAQEGWVIAPKPADEKMNHWVDSVMDGLSLQEQMGQLLMVTFPTRADKAARKHLRTLVKKYKIGGLVFAEGSAEEQTMLTNLAQKDARVPLLMAVDGGSALDTGRKGQPRFPDCNALECITDDRLLEEYGTEIGRELRLLGVHAQLASVPASLEAYVRGLAGEGVLSVPSDLRLLADSLVPSAVLHSGAADYLEAGSDMVCLELDAQEAIASLHAALKSGRLTKEGIGERCRKVLACKYRAGLYQRPAKLQVSGMSFRIGTDEARRLAALLREKAVTVLNNYFGVLPLSPAPDGRGIALLSLGAQGSDSVFVEAMQEHAGGIRCFRLPWGADESEKEAIRRQLQEFGRVVVSVAGVNYVGEADVDFLRELNLPAPLVYVCFTSGRLLPLLLPALSHANAVVLAHSAEPDLQQRVAKVLFAQAEACGRLSVAVGRKFPKGTGCDITVGMEPVAVLPDDYGMKSYVLQGIDDIARKGLEAGAYPGCRILVLKDGHPVYDRGFGCHSYTDTTAVRPTDLFDLASLTKVTATLLAVMKLYDEGRLKLEDRVSNYVPLLRGTDKRRITIRDLLLHESGLPPYIRFYLSAIDPRSVHGPYAQSWSDEWHQTRVSEHSYYSSDFKFRKGLMANKPSGRHTLHVAEGMWLDKNFKQTMLREIARCKLGERHYVYSDLGFILLQQVVEGITQLPLDLYVAKEFYAPMGLQRTLFCPLEKFPKTDIMPTAFNDFLRRQDLCGYVHDEAAALLGGVAGHAGLFSTAGEVAALCQMLLDGGVWKGKRFLSEETCRLFTTEKSLLSRRGLGFDKPDVSIVKRSPCAPSAPEAVYGHTGFTGTCAWVDPGSRTVYVFLSNRVCPDVWNTKLSDMDIRTDIQELIFKSLVKEEDL